MNPETPSRWNEVGSRTLTLEDVAAIARGNARVTVAPTAMARIAKGRAALDAALTTGEHIYGVNTGVGGNIKFALAPDQAEMLQLNIMRHLSCATGQPLPDDVVRAATLLRIATFATGCSAVRPELVEALVALLNAEITPIVPRYGSVGASGDLMPSAYIARALLGMGEANYQGKRMPAAEALQKAGLAVVRFAPKEGLALINGTTFMTAAAALIWRDATVVLRALLSALALAVEALEVPVEPYAPWVQQVKGHPGQIAVAEFMRARFEGSAATVDPAMQSCYSLRCAPQGLGQVWEALEEARPMLEREINSANDNPLIDPETGKIYRAGNFYGGHISRALDTWKIDFAIMANWAHSLMAVLVDDRFNRGLPANLSPAPGVNSGLKGMQLSVTSLTCAIRQLAGPSSIHSLPTETYNQDVVSLGMHSAVTALDSMECLRNETAMILIAAGQAAELRGKLGSLGAGTRRTFEQVRAHSPYLEGDRAMEQEVASLAAALGELN